MLIALPGCEFLCDVLAPEAPAPPTTPTICFADEDERSGEPATIDVRMAQVALAPQSFGSSPAFDDCVGDGDVWELVDGNGDHLWLGVVGAAAGIVDGIDAALAAEVPLSLHVATNRSAQPGSDIFALTLADTGVPVVAFQRNGPGDIADAGIVQVSEGGIPLVLSDECGLFEFPELLFFGGDVDLVDEAGVPDPETGELPVLVAGSVILGGGSRAAVFVDGEVVDVTTGVVFARTSANCPDPPPTGRFINWTALLRF